MVLGKSLVSQHNISPYEKDKSYLRAQYFQIFIAGWNNIHIPPPNFPFHEITMPPTPRVSIFLHLAFFIPHLPPLPDPHAPTFPPRHTSAVTISYGKGSSNLPSASGSGTISPISKRRRRSCVSSGVVFLYFFSIFLSFLV